MKIIRAMAVFLLVWLLGAQCVFGEENAEEPLKLYAQSAVLIDGSSGRVLYGKGADTVRPMASTTKIMTCILALELGNPEEEVTATAKAASQPKVRLGVRKGEVYKLKDLLYALMLESYNDAAMMIAEKIGGDAEKFAELMNEKAKELGCEQTYFITPNGLDGRERDGAGQERIHSTTAAELARIMRYCILESPKKEEFLEITRTQSYFFKDKEGKRSFSCNNHNALLNMMEGAVSGKTGFTGGAGYSYVGALEDEGRTYIIALLGCGWPPHKTWKWSDARRLFDYGMEHYTLKDVFRPEAFSPIPVTGGLCWGEGADGGQTEVVLGDLEAEEHLFLLMKEGENVRVRRELPKALKAPVKKGQRVGTVEYSIEGNVLKRYGIYAKNDVEKLTLPKAVYRIAHCFVIF